jgi:hypothetical protein
MSKNVGDYYSKATQSVFIIAGVLMLVTFPYFFKQFEFGVYGILAVIVLLAIGAGWAGGGNALTRKINILIAIIACAISSFKAVTLFFNGVEDQLAIFSFWILQILSLIFFFAIYFSIRAGSK